MTSNSWSREVCPRAGLLVFFPAWLSHSVTPLYDGVDGDPERRGQLQRAEVDSLAATSRRTGFNHSDRLGQRIAIAFNAWRGEGGVRLPVKRAPPQLRAAFLLGSWP